LLAGLLKGAWDGVDLYVLITIRADSVERLLQGIAELGLEAPEPLYLLPLSPGAYRDVILRPAEAGPERQAPLRRTSTAAQLVADATGADSCRCSLSRSQLFCCTGLGELTPQHNEIGGMGGRVTRVLRQRRTAGAHTSLVNLISAATTTSGSSLYRACDVGLAASAAKRLVAKEAELNRSRHAGAEILKAISERL
jgi:hypothetical protein